MSAERKLVTWSVKQPVLAKVGERTVVARTRPGLPPERWFDDTALTSAGLSWVTFDFFVDWSDRTLSQPLWLKRVATRDPGGIAGYELEAVRRVLAADATEGQRLNAFASANGLEPSWMIIPDWHDWMSGSGNVLRCPIGTDGLPSTVELLTYAELRQEIARFTGERFVPQKGLYWSTTDIEAALARTDTPWPGDADLVLVDVGAPRLPRAIIEFRKVTQDVTLGSSFDDYYATKDRRRWDRLAVLAQHFTPSPKLLACHYSIDARRQSCVMHTVKGAPGALSRGDLVELVIPEAATTDAFTSRVIAEFGV